LNFFIQAHVLTKRLKDWDVILGIIGTIAFSAVGTTALSWVRRWSYRLFYTTHVVLASILLPVLFFHVSHIRIYMVETCLIYIFHLALRKITEHKVSGSLTIIQGAANLVQVDIPISAKSAFMQWQPGQHVYISPASGSSYMRPFKSRSPFTVASLPSEDKNLRVVARVLDGNTAALAKAASECMAAGKDASIMPLVVEGPYGLSTHSRALLGYNRVLFIAGGVGATFIVPLYRTLLRDLSPSPGSRRRQKVAFVWVVRSEIETTWALPQDEQEKRGMQERMTVYATRGSATDGDEQKTGDMSADEIELEQLLPNGEGGEGGERGETGLAASQGWSVRDGRPNLGDVVDKTFSHTQEGGKVAVLICGPKSMADEVRRNSSKWAGKRDMWLHVEAYGL
jgi:predicted ferric reductase